MSYVITYELYRARQNSVRTKVWERLVLRHIGKLHDTVPPSMEDDIMSVLEIMCARQRRGATNTRSVSTLLANLESIQSNSRVRVPRTMTISTFDISPFRRPFATKDEREVYLSMDGCLPRTYVAKGIVGQGIFVDEAVPYGHIIMECTGIRIDKDWFHATHNNGENDFVIGVRGDNTVLDPTTGGNDSGFINHSCSPNCFLEEVRIGEKWIVVIRAGMNLERHTEMFIDYEFNSIVTNMILLCVSESSNCRLGV